MSLQVSVIRDDDQNNRDDDDDDEFVAMTADELEEELAEGDAESIEVSLDRQPTRDEPSECCNCCVIESCLVQLHVL